MNPHSFFTELKRRNVYKVAIAYGVVAWLLLQAASILFPTFEAPPWTMKVFVAVIALGFPVALILAWAFELTPEGIKRAEDVDLSKSITRKTGRKLDFFIIAVLLLVIAILVFQRLRPSALPAVSSSLEKSIAVLPFENLSRDPDNAYFAEGIQEEICPEAQKHRNPATKHARGNSRRLLLHGTPRHSLAGSFSLPKPFDLFGSLSSTWATSVRAPLSALRSSSLGTKS